MSTPNDELERMAAELDYDFVSFKAGYRACEEKLNAQIDPLKKENEIYKSAIRKAIKADQHESIYPEGPGILKAALDKVKAIREEKAE
jgi:hypothetical protein